MQWLRLRPSARLRLGWIDVASETPNNTSLQPHSVLRPVPAAAGTYGSPKALQGERGQYPASTASPSYVVLSISSPALDSLSHLCKHQQLTLRGPDMSHLCPRPHEMGLDRESLDSWGFWTSWDPLISCVSKRLNATGKHCLTVYKNFAIVPPPPVRSGALSTLAPFFIYPNKGRHNQAIAWWKEPRSLISLGHPGRAKEPGPGPSKAVPGFQNVPRAAAVG